MKFSVLGLIVVSFLLAGCFGKPNKEKLKETILEIVKDDPSIITLGIKEHPEQVLKAFEYAAREYQMSMMRKRAEGRKADFENSFNSPLNPSIDNDAIIRGPKDAPITLVEYSDFECPFCKRGYETVMDLMKEYKGNIRFIYKHLPLNIHRNAEIAARYFEALRLQGEDKAWKFHDSLLENQKLLSSKGVKFMEKEIKKLGGNVAKVKKDAESSKIKAKVKKDIAEAEKFKFSGTPGFILNGIPVRGALPPSEFVNIIKELEKRGKLKI